MEYRLLGRTGLRVPLVSFGCVELGLPYGIGISEADVLPDTQAIDLVRTAVAEGMTFFDTAPSYGKSERLLGEALEGLREQVVLCTKCPGLTAEDGTVLRGGALRDRLLSSVEASLKALRTDWLDILMLHRTDRVVIESDEVAMLFGELKDEGIIRASGASTYPGGITGTVIERGCWDVIQLAFHLMDQRETAYLDAAREAGIGIVVRSVLFKGILTDRGAALHPALESISAHRRRCIESTPAGMTLAEFATRFAMSKLGVTSVLIGIDRPEYLEQALRMAKAGSLAAAELAVAEGLAYPDPAFIDLHHWAEQGWLT